MVVEMEGHVMLLEMDVKVDVEEVEAVRSISSAVCGLSNFGSSRLNALVAVLDGRS